MSNKEQAASKKRYCKRLLILRKAIRNKPIPENSDERLFRKYLTHCKGAWNRGKENYLTLQKYVDIITKPCTYCGQPSTGADRLNSNIGYTISNSVPACVLCNIMKFTFSKETFLKQAEKIHNFNSSK